MSDPAAPSSASLDLSDRITAVVESDLAIDVPSTDYDLVEAGVLDSLGLVTLVASLEDEFAISIPLQRVAPEAFRTVDAMAHFVIDVFDADPSCG